MRALSSFTKRQGMGNSIAPNIDNASKTGVLQLSNRKIEKIPEDITKLKDNLRTVDFSSNKIRDIPPWICNCPHLKQLNFSSNRLIELPGDIGNLKKLETLNISMNMIYSLPQSLELCKNLRNVYITSNGLKDFPIQLCQNPPMMLDLLDLSRNHIDKLPPQIENLQALELNLNYNKLTSLAEGLAKCPRLKVLRLEGNVLKAADIHEVILADSNISVLAVDGNNFTLKQLESRPGYDKYLERYTASKKKMF